jgi:hypothetical protein
MVPLWRDDLATGAALGPEPRVALMAYARVIPRDLFNEASLLKCLGALELELSARRTDAELDEEELGSSGFDIDQDEADGSISVVNLPFLVNGQRFRLYRPLNSREPWPLWVGAGGLLDPDFDDLEVFQADGKLSMAFLAFINAELSPEEARSLRKLRPLPPVERGIVKGGL